MNQQSEKLAPNGRIGPYRSLALQGEGGMGVVYRGTDPAGRDVAIKVLRPEIVGDRTERRRLGREIDLMRRVLSPHVADVLDGDATADPPYVVTRFVPGRPLDQAVAEQGRLTGGALRRLALGLAKALTAIHEAGVVHRDLNPGNVLMVPDGQGGPGEPVVIDFGIAHAVDVTRLTRAATAGCLAPEMIDAEPATPASDVHAWAATVAFAATGRPPFGQGSLDVVLSDIRNCRARLDGVPEPLLPLLRRALERDPAARPTATELVEAVNALDLGPDEPPAPQAGTVVAAPHVPAGPAVAPERPTRVEPRSRLPVGPAWSRMLAALTVVLVVAVAIMMPVVGIVVAVAGAFALRAGDCAARTGGLGAGDVARAALRTALTLPYAAVFAVTVTLALAALVVAEVKTAPLGACAWGAGAGAAALWAGPGVRAPRRQLERVFGALGSDSRRLVLAGGTLGPLAFAAVIGAVSLTPSFAPMYGLQNSVVSALEQFQHRLP